MDFPPCPYCHTAPITSAARTVVRRAGTFLRQNGSRHQRYRCNECRRTFSNPTFTDCYRQRRRDLNSRVLENLASGVSQRRSAIMFRCNIKTVARKFCFLGAVCARELVLDRARFPPSLMIEFDDLETFEHTKMKPLSACFVVETGTRRILGFNVAQMPCRGRLAERSREKYGARDDDRKGSREWLFQQLRPYIAVGAIIKSDKNPHYNSTIRRLYPDCVHKTFKGRKAREFGLGELKTGGFDPLFTLNHTLAMTRANINRLFRKTWCTTKKASRLYMHLAIYSIYHNWKLIPQSHRSEALSSLSA